MRVVRGGHQGGDRERLEAGTVKEEGGKVQQDWTPCADAQKNNFPRGQEGYDGFETMYEKLSLRGIHWCGKQCYIFFFGELFLKNTAGLDLQYNPTKLQHFRDHRWKAHGKDNPNLL